MGNVGRDVIYTIRSLSKAPAMTFVIVLCVAPPLALNGAIFSMVHAVLVGTIPFEEPDRIVRVVSKVSPRTPFPVGGATFERWRTETTTFSALAGYRPTTLTLSGGGPSIRVKAAEVPSTLVPTLGLTPFMGRAFARSEEYPPNNHVVALSYRLWAARFGREHDIMGKALSLDGTPYLVVAVMPAGFVFPARDVDVWLPLNPGATVQRLPDGTAVYAVAHFSVLGRLAKGASLSAATTETEAALNS